MRLRDILTLEELAEGIGVSMRTVQRWRDEGMPTIKKGDVIRIYRPHFMKWFLSFKEGIENGKEETDRSRQASLSLVSKV
jgi:phage terminase Nu1 subunit (DNA packaging protein)